MPTVNLELRTRPNKAGYCKLRVIMQDRGKRVYMPLNVSLLPSEWDSKTQRVRSTHPKSSQINHALDLKIADLKASVAIDSMAGPLSLDKIAGRKVSKTPFRSFAIDCLGRWEKTKSPATIAAYRSNLKYAHLFDPTASVEDITPDWLARFEDYTRQTCNDPGTLKRLAFVSVIIKEALRKSIIQRDPFLIYSKPPKVNPPKTWLTRKELQAIEKLAGATKSMVIRKSAYWFLLSCYTGLRYSDIEKFDHKRMVQDGRLILYTQKTGEVVSIKLTRKIRELINITKRIGPVYSNQKVNQYLKAIAHLSKVDKSISFHSARHTFAVQCANLGISIEVTSKLLGHSDLKVTGIYYKLVNVRIDKEMEKWER